MDSKDDILTLAAIGLRKMFKLMTREEPYCLQCGAEVENLYLEGRCVYAEPCHHRQYQADKVPAEWSE